MKYKLQAFMMGRNGLDQLSKVIAWASLICMLVSCFISVEWLRSLLYGVALAALIYSYFRMFSKNLAKRQAENAKFVNRWSFTKSKFQQRKTHRFYRCPSCKTQLRVPKGMGKINITCRSCGQRFIKKT